MLYILCEDGGSGFEFWKIFNEVLLESKAKVVTARGKDKITAKFIAPIYDTSGAVINNVAQNVEREIYLKSGDTLLIAFDNIGGFFVENLLLDATLECLRTDSKSLITSYYCFEEIFLSFADLFNYCAFEMANEKFNADLDIKQVQAQLDFLHRVIIAREDYFTDSLFKYLFDMSDKYNSNGVLKNREQFAADYLDKITKKAVGCFRVSKSLLGECWRYSCNCAIEKAQKTNPKVTRYRCTFCSLKDTCPEIKDRLLHLLYTSVFSVGGVFLKDLYKCL